MSLHGHLRPTLATRAVAVLASALVLALAVLAASPELHERLHGHGLHTVAAAHPGAGHGDAVPAAPDDEDGCIVSLFAQGVVLALAAVALLRAGLALSHLRFVLRDRVPQGPPRYLRLPAQAPPLGLS